MELFLRYSLKFIQPITHIRQFAANVCVRLIFSLSFVIHTQTLYLDGLSYVDQKNKS